MSLESVLHKIVYHLPVNPSVKDELEKEITAEFGDKEESSAPE